MNENEGVRSGRPKGWREKKRNRMYGTKVKIEGIQGGKRHKVNLLKSQKQNLTSQILSPPPIPATSFPKRGPTVLTADTQATGSSESISVQVRTTARTALAGLSCSSTAG